ncbi:Hypp6388 [Branchiostoma lanceolatum]|uniref:Hypp6388 protein n=1 Tax=Branchiostoma lanceolatum TaxID=7740 RepID=A0A8K0E490_BRALA|nr:Hypp6388 [Branchiostoma lanceolatum]
MLTCSRPVPVDPCFIIAWSGMWSRGSRAQHLKLAASAKLFLHVKTFHRQPPTLTMPHRALVHLQCIVFIFIPVFLDVVGGCIELLNGWDPVPVAERARRADVVFSGTVVRTDALPRLPGLTYSAHLRVRTVLRGKSRLREIPAISDNPNVYNVSNFGLRAQCYSEVAQGDAYIFFLGIFHEGELAARYDDIFGATAGLTRENEEEILLALGESQGKYFPILDCV